MRYALVRGNKVENLIELQPEELVEILPSETKDDWSQLVTKNPGRSAWVPPEGFEIKPAEMAIEIGWEWNQGAPAPVPVSDEIVLTQNKASKLNEIAAAKEAAINSGVEFEGKSYQIDDLSQGRILARAVFARAAIDGEEEWPEDFGWIAMDNTRPLFTAAKFWELANKAQMRVTAITLNARALKDAVLAAETIEDLQTVVISGL